MRTEEGDEKGMRINVRVIEPGQLGMGTDEGLRVADQFKRHPVRFDLPRAFPTEVDRLQELKGDEEGQEEHRQSGHVRRGVIVEPSEACAPFQDEMGKGKDEEHGQ